MTDLDLLDLVLSASLTEREREAFAEMRDNLASGERVTLSAKQRDWATTVARAHELLDEPAQNLWSSGKVPFGMPGPKTRGELEAERVLSMRPKAPPGARRAG